MSRLGKYRANTIVVGDCLEVMSELPDGCIDLIVTDPPWAVSREVVIHRRKDSLRFPGSDISLDFGVWDHFDSERDYWRFIKAWLGEQARVLKDSGALSNVL